MANSTNGSGNGTIHASPEDDSILSFLTTDFLESQTTNATFDSAQFFDTLPTDGPIKYQDLLHPLSPPTSVGTFSESSGSPQHLNMDSCDEGSGSDVPMENNPLDYWQYVYSDLTQPSSSFPVLSDLTQQQQQQPGAWPNLTNMDASLLQSSVISSFPAGALADSINTNSGKRSNSATPNTPPSPATSLKAEKTEKKSKRVKKQAPTPSQPAALAPLAPLKPLMPLAPLVQLAPAPLSPPTTVHDVFIKQSPPLSPRIISAPPASGPAGGAAIRKPSIVPALTPSMARSNPVVVKSTLIPDEKPQSEAAMSAQAKRQERLIKNRAAALLSRKRKREHINLLETHTDILKTTNQELTERVSELEENVKVLTVERDTAREERDSARRECERLHRQISGLTHKPQSDAFRMDMDLERNIRAADTERGLNSKATGVVFMIILFSFALFNLPGGKLETLMVGGSIDRPRIGSSVIGRALDSYTNNPTISGQVRESAAHRKDLHNMTDLVVFSDNRALQTWLGHQPVVVPSKTSTGVPSGSSASVEKEPISESLPAISDENNKSVGFVAQDQQPLPWSHTDAPQEINEPDRDAWLYCSNLLYSLRTSSVVKAAGPAQATNGRPRMSIISPLDGVAGSSANENNHMPPWMPNSNPTEGDSEQKYLRLDVEVTSSRVVSGKGLGDHEQVIRFPSVPFGVFDNSTSSLVPSKAAAPTPVSTVDGSTSPPFERKRSSHHSRSSRVNAQGGIVKTRRIYDHKDQLLRGVQADSKAASSALHEEPMPLVPIKEEPIEVYIKEELVD
ncbi:hypothetical protein BGZ80_000716 [Entomortierella chlamydospora]|uniref:BZIP domain-containing protein n=1 Tax=Entomortierella chlamydospora TaxID=101097 RepID=A0A9P6SYH2_9FUNG|nr:hypothetical protein BGZ80_000716 [Entomortierella chlamydospora]